MLDDANGIARVVCGATAGPPVLLPATCERLAQAGADAALGVVGDEVAAVLAHDDDTSRQLHAVAVQRALRQLA